MRRIPPSLRNDTFIEIVTFILIIPERMCSLTIHYKTSDKFSLPFRMTKQGPK